MLGKLTLEPDQFGPKDVEQVRALGVSDEAIADAMYVCVLFNIIDRCSDVLDFQLPEDFDAVKHGTALLKLGYSWIVGEPVAVPGPAAASSLA